MIEPIRQVFDWFFRNRETGAITIAQAPNLLLWIVIVTNAAAWIAHPPGAWGTALAILAKIALVVWALDELLRGVNPWRRCLGFGIVCYALATIHVG